MMPRLKQKYLSEIRPALIEEFGYDNLNAVPKIRPNQITVSRIAGPSLRTSRRRIVSRGTGH